MPVANVGESREPTETDNRARAGWAGAAFVLLTASASMGACDSSSDEPATTLCSEECAACCVREGCPADEPEVGGRCETDVLPGQPPEPSCTYSRGADSCPATYRCVLDVWHRLAAPESGQGCPFAGQECHSEQECLRVNAVCGVDHTWSVGTYDVCNCDSTASCDCTLVLECPYDQPVEGKPCQPDKPLCNLGTGACHYGGGCSELLATCGAGGWELELVPNPLCVCLETYEQAACEALGCEWLTPGCGELLTLASSGCFATEPCADHDDCPTGYICDQRLVNGCADSCDCDFMRNVCVVPPPFD
jgi:hypothetical protein